MTTRYAAEAVLLALCLTGCWTDITTRRLPNLLVLVTLVAGLAFSAVQLGIAVLPLHLLHVAVALVIGMLLFRLGIVGGGDAKYYAALASWFAFGSDALRLLFAVSAFGFVAFVVWFTWRRLNGKKVKSRDLADADKFPYGVAMAAGAFLVYALG